MPFKFLPFPELPRVVLIDPPIYEDDRGWFAERYRASEFRANGIPDEFVQDNQALSIKKGTLRGLHFQNPPKPQGKLVQVAAGEILDVAVDIRKGSPTYGKHVSGTLSAKNRRIMWVPPGFAHGVLTLEENSVVQYKCTGEFSQEHDRSIRWDDPELGIKWPVRDPVLSAKDRHAPLLSAVDNKFVYEARSAVKAERLK